MKARSGNAREEGMSQAMIAGRTLSVPQLSHRALRLEPSFARHANNDVHLPSSGAATI